MNGRTPGRDLLWVEYAFIAAILAGLAWSAWFFFKYRYLPQPWFYEPSGTFMDWYSLSIWGHQKGAYVIAGSIYPPLSFVVLRLFSIESCYPHFEAEWARSCDTLGIYALTGILIVNAVLTFLTFRKHDRESYVPRAFALSFGFPMLFAYERGNLLLFGYAALVLGFGPLLKSARLRWVFGGLALNFKVYMVSVIAAPLLRRRWLQTEMMLVWGVIIYLVTWLIQGEGSPGQLLTNVTSYLGGFGAGGFLDLWYASSFVPAIDFLQGRTAPITTLLDLRLIDILLPTVTGFMRTVQASLLLAAAAAWLRPEVVTTRRVAFIALALALCSSEAGGYTQILLLFFVFMEKWGGAARNLSLIIAYTLCVPVEIVIMQIPPMVHESFLGGTEVIAPFGVGLMSFVRLIGCHVIMLCLSWATILEVCRDIQVQGWRHRWRYRNDAPILPFVDRPAPVAGGQRPQHPAV